MRKARLILAAAAVLCVVTNGRGALVFNFSGNVSQQMLDGFTAAGQRWSSRFSHDMTVNIGLSTAALGASSIANTSPVVVVQPYENVRAALVADASSADDLAAVAHLPAGASLSF